MAARRPTPKVGADAVDGVAAALRSQRAALLLGGPALRERGLRAAARVAAASGCRVLHETFPAVIDRGGGLFAPERLNYLGELAVQQLDGIELLVLVGATAPVSFFAYPSLPSSLVPEGCSVVSLAGLDVDVAGALEDLATTLGAPATTDATAHVTGAAPATTPTGALTAAAFSAAIGAVLPAGCVVVDESNTSGVGLFEATKHAGPHSWLTLTGGAIGYGLPAAVGAAIAARGRRVVCLESDGSMSYTPQALWTMAREGLDVTTVCCSNDSYAILNFELMRVGATASGERARAMLDLTGPTLDLARTAESYGVPASTATSADELVVQLEKALATEGPSFINARLTRG